MKLEVDVGHGCLYSPPYCGAAKRALDAEDRKRGFPVGRSQEPACNGAGLKGKPKVKRRKESEACPVCGGTKREKGVRPYKSYPNYCYVCNGTGKRIAPPNPKRPRPEATFAQWWKTKMIISDDGAELLRGFTVGMLKDQARRAWNAGRRAAKKKRN